MPLEIASGDLNRLLYFQAYYGPRVPMPQYYNSAVASGHPPHPYMWGPPQVIPKYINYYIISLSFFLDVLVHILDDRGD